MSPRLSLPRSPRAAYLLALGLVAGLSMLASLLLSSLIGAQEGSAATINVSGRQRMLSQRTALFALQLATAPGPERGHLRAALRADAATLEQVHAKLAHPAGGLSPRLRALYFGPGALDSLVRAHLSRLDVVLKTPDARLTPDSPALRALLRDAPGPLLAGLNAAVGAYEAEAEARVARLRRLEGTVLAITLLTLLLEGLLIFRPMERELARRSAQLVHDAFHDALTGLPNRALFLDRLGQALARRGREPGAHYGVLFLDCDRFKVINDSLGHAVGDALLVALAHRLRGALRDGDTVARLGGDEFTVLLSGLERPGDAVQVAERLGRAVAEPLEAAGHTLHVTASIGVLTSADGHARPDDVLQAADLAMYRAKALGRDRVEAFAPELRERAAALMDLERELRGAEARGELGVHYQPVVALPGGEVRGFEALLRWTHPTLGPVSPGEFIPVAEDCGLIVDLDRFVLRGACAQVAAWQRAWSWAPPLTLSVNVSGRHLTRPDLPGTVARALEESGLAPHQLRLELTESVLAADTPELHAALAALRALGVGLYIDDFGTGYSNLAYLHRLSADAIKIDRTFVSRLTHSPEGAGLVRTIIAMARSLGLGVVAEGVETQAQRDTLATLGCEASQGYLFSRPMPADAAADFLADRQHEGRDVPA